LHLIDAAFDTLPVVTIKVLFFGLLKDICGRAEDQLELPASATLKTVFDHYAAIYPRLAGMAASTVLARNQEFAPPSTALSDGDEVAFLPPVSGGASVDKAPGHEIIDPEGHFFILTRDVLDPRAAESRLLEGSDGAVVTFHGVVRNNTKGRTTLRLEYEGYEQMAIRKMAEIGREVAKNHSIGRIAILHRLGTLEIGEASVLVIVTSPHRRAAFHAALEGIDQLKKLVPIWKKEFFADGEVWVEGDWDQNAPRASS
jgi:molybdopterin converting factor subunit 1